LALTFLAGAFSFNSLAFVTFFSNLLTLPAISNFLDFPVKKGWH